MVERLAERSHLSIGEVLSLLRDEFPDVTISKIRFLESQGLVDPERTPSGYRKFYDQDVERLRWILRQQREHYMPLKVIRSRLSASSDGAVVEVQESVETVTAVVTDTRPDPEPQPQVEPETEPESEPQGAPEVQGGSARATPSLFAGLRAKEEPAAPAPGAAPLPPTPPRPERGSARPEGNRANSERNPVRSAPTPPPGPPPMAGDDPDTYTPEELAEAAGTDVTLVGELKQYGLITPHATVAGTQYYDDGALAVVRAAAEFARHGVEARHLRIWRNAADRESDLMQQVVLPLLRQRNPQARKQALDTLAELSQAGADLRAALVERAVRDIR